mgnify:FL=1
MKLKVGLLGLLLVALKSSAQITMVLDLPGYEVSHSLEVPGRQLFGFTHNLSLGQFGFRFAERLTVCAGYKLSAVQNKYAYQKNYFEKNGLQGDYTATRSNYHSLYFPIPTPNFQVRYHVRESFLGYIELGFGSMMRFSYLNPYRSYFFEEPGVDHWDPDRRTYSDIKRFEMTAPLRRVLTHSLSLRKSFYFGVKRTRLIVEPFVNVTKFDLVWREVSAKEDNDYYSYNSNFEPLGTRIVPEFGFKLALGLDLKPGFMNKLNGLFEPAE